MNYNRIINPTNQYRNELTKALIHERPLPDYRTTIKYELAEYDDPLLQLLAQGDFSRSDYIMELQFEKFGRPNKKIYKQLLAALKHDLKKPISKDLQKVFENADNQPTVIPTQEIFLTWRQLQKQYFTMLFVWLKQQTPMVKTYSAKELKQLLENVLEKYGFSNRAWRVVITQKTNLVSVAKKRKKILITDRKIRLSRPRLFGLILHEIIVHVAKTENEMLISENMTLEEGRGVVVEQLSLSNFHLLRVYRYLAIYLACGIDGQKRNIRDIYHLLLELRRATKTNENTFAAQRFVASEIVRVYRSFPTNIKGLVYVRDKVYVEASLELWQKLIQAPPTNANYCKLVLGKG